MSDTPLSGASLGLDKSTDGHDATPGFDAPDDARYVDGGLLGKGGMGEVRAAHDRRLSRTVALKTSREQGRGRDSLVLEAQLTARLEHPGIVPVYGAGETADGRPYYTMPVVRGRSLGQAIAEASSLAERLRLVRHFVDACQAVAYAHSEGVLHRDIKPANVMVGEFGETLVVDWGLSVTLLVAKRGVSSAGTPEYSAPEQRAGGALDTRSDVYSLGASLHELLTGARPSIDDLPPLQPHSPTSEIPRELAAVVHKATAARREERYSDVTALVADVEAWFEGRRVGAYDYTAWDLLRRFVSEWRTPLLLVLLGFAATAFAVANGYRNTTAERDRAISAEGEAISARERSDSNLGQALVAQAVEAAADGRRAEAELLAARALGISESPDARGVLAQSWGQDRPRLLHRVEQPPCVHVFDSFGDEWLCRETNGLSRRRLRGEVVEVVGAIDENVISARLVDDAVFFGDPDLGYGRWDEGGVNHRTMPGQTLFIDSDRQVGPVSVYGNGNVFSIPRAGGAAAVAEGADMQRGVADIALVGTTTLYLLRGGQIEARAPGPPPTIRTVGHLPLQGGVPMRLSAAQDGSRRVAATGSTGTVYVADIDDVSAGFGFDSGLSVLAGRALLYDQHLVVFSPEVGVVLYDLESRALIATLPGRALAVHWMGPGLLRLLHRDAVEDWAVPSHLTPHVIPHSSGISAVSVDHRGELVASAHGLGQIRIASLSTGATVTEAWVHHRVMKDVAFAPGSDVLVAAPAERHILVRMEGPDWEPQIIPATDVFRRVAWTSDSELLAIPYGWDIVRFTWEGGAVSDSRFGFGDRFVDLDRHEGAAGVVLRAEPGEFFEVVGERITQLGEDVSGRGIAAGGGVVAVLASRRLTIHDEHGTRSVTWEGPENQDVAVSADGRFVAVGRVDGTIIVWDPGSLKKLAVLRGHTARVAGLAFTPDGKRLVTGSWDGDVRVWSVDALHEDAAALRATLEQSWGLSAEEVLSSEF